jgi:hypothetical protein
MLLGSFVEEYDINDDDSSPPQQSDGGFGTFNQGRSSPYHNLPSMDQGLRMQAPTQAYFDPHAPIRSQTGQTLPSSVGNL